MEYYIHQIPGRIRVKIPSIKGDQTACQRVERLFVNMHGVESVAVNHVTGSTKVTYDKSTIDSDRILQVLRENNLFDETKAVTTDAYTNKVVSETAEKFGKAVFSWAIGRALEANGLSLLAALI